MFRPIRKRKNEIDRNAVETLLNKSRRGVLAVNGEDGYPYAFPLIISMTRKRRRSIFTARGRGIRSTPCERAIRSASRFMEMKPSEKKRGRRLCRALSYLADAICLMVVRAQWQC